MTHRPDHDHTGPVDDREAERRLAARDAALADRDHDPTTDTSGIPAAPDDRVG